MNFYISSNCYETLIIVPRIKMEKSAIKNKIYQFYKQIRPYKQT